MENTLFLCNILTFIFIIIYIVSFSNQVIKHYKNFDKRLTEIEQKLKQQTFDERNP